MNTTTKIPGSGAISCECHGHKDRCNFGRPHVWVLAPRRPGIVEEADCMTCGSHCEVSA